MKKKIISLMTAAVLVVSMGTTVFAASSPTAGQVSAVKPSTTQNVQVEKVEVKDSSVYASNTKATGVVKDATTGDVVDANVTVNKVSNDTVATTAKEIETQLKNVEQLAANTANSDALKAAAKDSNKRIVTEIKTVVNIKAGDGVVVTEANPITLTISADVKVGDSVVILHWNGSAWETIKPSEVRDGEVVATFTSLSPVAVVKLSAADITNGGSGSTGTTGTTGTTSAAGTTNQTTTTTKTTNTTNTTKTSPKTGWSLL